MNTPTPPPPRLATRLLRWFCAPHRLEEMEQDLDELFQERIRTIGLPGARSRYWRDVLSLLRPEFIKRQPAPTSHPTHMDMVRNYVKIAWRHLAKNKGVSAINIGGLAVGMAVALLNGLWLWDEFSFNTYHENYDRIAQVLTSGTDERGAFVNKAQPYPLATELKTNHRRHFDHLVMASWVQDHILSAGDTKLTRTGQFVEPEAPEMLTLNMTHGSRTGLNDPHSILLSASTARALFGDADPIDRMVRINNRLAVTVTGVFEDLPHNTEFHSINFFAPWALWLTDNPWIQERAVQNWSNHFLRIYAQIKPGTSFEQVSQQIRDAELNNIRQLEGLQEQAATQPQVFLQPMRQWHLYGNFKRGILDEEPVRMVWLVGTIGLFVLLLACINFMNLSTARSEKRAKEVGIRKAVGSQRSQLISQFFSESFVVVLLAFGLALVLAWLWLPWFNQIAAKEIRMPLTKPWFWGAGLAFILLTSFLAGSYPALYLSSFRPVRVLKGLSTPVRIDRLTVLPRKVLVVIQFAVSVSLITGTIIVYRQIQHARNRPVGYDRNGLLTLEMRSDDFAGKYDLLRTELKKTGAVIEMSASMGKVTEVGSGNGGFAWRGKDPAFEDDFGTLTVTPEHGRTVGWQFLAGRDFSRDFASDSAGIVINETAARYMGLKHPVGEPVSWTFNGRKLMDYKILGVIRDMVMESPYEPIKPTIFFIKGHVGVNWLNLRINPAVSVQEALPKIEAVFGKIVPAVPFDYRFVDQEYALKFAAEERIGTLAAFFATLAIFISFLGLFGLASFMAEQRTKEIGIRKVLGASVFNLWQLLSRDFVVLVLIAFLIATPTAYYVLNGWLQKYTYRTELSWWIFALTGAGAVAVTLLTVSFQAIRAARMNPVRSLRME